MLSVHHLSKSFGDTAVLKNISFNLNAGDRLGLIGPNGCGKTTLIRILAGLDHADQGGIGFTPNNLRVGYLPQGLAFKPDETIQEFLDRSAGNVDVLADRLAALAETLTQQPQNSALQTEYNLTLARLESAAESAGRSPLVLDVLGLSSFPLDTPSAILSGGQKTRLALAGVLLSNPQLLLLDEPTNHLDITMLRWLEDWLIQFSKAALIVSHDRAFLDRTATGILELDPKTMQINAYPGNYSDYAARKTAEFEKQRQEYQDQQQKIAQIQRAENLMRSQAQFKKGGKADQHNRWVVGYYRERAKEKMATAKRYEKQLDYLTGKGAVEKPKTDWQVKIEFGDLPESGEMVMRLENGAIGYDHPLLSGLNLVLRKGQRIGLTGPNGCGKTTLLRTIAGRLPLLDGQIRLGSNVRLGYMAQEQETLDPTLNVLETLQREAALSETNARNFLHRFLFTGDEVFRQISCLSFGERSLLALALLAARGCNFLLLDEPINHLDIPSRARFEQALAGYEGTILAVVHDRYFLQEFAESVWGISSGVIQEFAPAQLTLTESQPTIPHS